MIKMVYGPYASAILNSNLQLSVPNESEYSLPQVKVGQDEFVIRESPYLRYQLWKVHSPDLVLLGSSMLFMNFNRALFYTKYPKHLMIDFCIGDNTPPITFFLLKKLRDCNLWFRPGTTVIYGINTYELLAGYDGKTWPHIYEALKNVDDNGFKKRFNQWIRRFLKSQGPKYLIQSHINKLRRGSTSYMLPVSKEMEHDPDKLKRWLIDQTPKINVGTNYPLDVSKAEKLQTISNMVKKSKSKFVIVLLPSSTWDIVRFRPLIKSLDRILNQIAMNTGAEYVNLWDHKKVGIDDTDYIIKGHNHLKVNPQHLNYNGTIKFTNYLINNVIKRDLTN